MTAVLSQEGEISLPVAVREELHLSSGDSFEIDVQDGDTIVLRRVDFPVNQGLIDLLLACPADLDIPEREKDNTSPLSLIGK